MAQRLTKLEARAARAGFIGTVIEYYDFLSYAFLATIIAAKFFPEDDPTTGLLATLGVYGAGYVARPVGAAFFGWLGDRRGRKTALLSTVVAMALGTCVMGILPTYATIGVAAPVLLVVIRLVQGFAAGGELAGATTYVAESAHPSRRGLLLAAAPFGAGFGSALAPATVGVVGLLVSSDAMADWGWRIPFLLSVPLLVASVYLRVGLEDSPEFKRMVEQSEVVRAPIVEVFRKHGGAMFRVVILAIAMSSPAFLVTAYMNIFLTESAGLSKQTTYWMSAAVLALALVGHIVGGRLVDRIGVRRSLLGALAASCVIVWPILYMMGTVGNVWLVALCYLVLAFVSNIGLPTAYAAIFTAFPGPVRYTGSAIGSNIGSMIGAGFAPYLAGLLTVSTGLSTAPAFLVIVGTVLGMIVAPGLTRNVRERFRGSTEPRPEEAVVGES